MLPERYTVEGLKNALRNPGLFAEELKFLLHTRTQRRAFVDKHGSGLDVMAEDWDNLLLLDACRYDTFEAVNDITGDLRSVVSRGSTSYEFMRKNFADRELHDTVYVTGNGNTERIADDVFFKIVKTYDRHERRYRGWMPDHIREVAAEAHEAHPDKRLVVHFMQPHTPYIGPKADRIRGQLRDEHGMEFEKMNVMHGSDADDPDLSFSQLRNAAEDGYITDDVLYDLYVENLEIVLEEVERLLEELDGRSVVSTDHGELLGDPDGWFVPKRYGHPGNVYTPELRVVPWLEVDGGERRETVSEPPVETTDVPEEAIEENLRALGYVD
ncbi:MAG: hypothetical protein PPP58_10140 [Natronomonas sp.]